MQPHVIEGNIVAEYNYGGTKVIISDAYFAPPEEQKRIIERIGQMYVNTLVRQAMAKEKAAV